MHASNRGHFARLDEWYSALVRSATTRASIAILLQKEPWMGSAEMIGSGQTMGDIAARSIGANQGEPDAGREDVRPVSGIRGERRIDD